MQTATFIHEPARGRVRAHRRAPRPRRAFGVATPRRAQQVVARAALRYADDPIGNYETTEGGW